jgi:hypothetical protein
MPFNPPRDPQPYTIALTTNSSEVTNSATVYVMVPGKDNHRWPDRRINLISISEAKRIGRPILLQVFDPDEASWVVCK